MYEKLSNFIKAVLQAVQETVEELTKIKPILSDYWDKEVVSQGFYDSSRHIRELKNGLYNAWNCILSICSH